MKKEALLKFLKYVIFAVLTSLINIGVYLLCMYLIEWKIPSIQGTRSCIIISNFIAYSISITMQFFINKNVVFKNNKGHIVKQLVLFLLVKLVAFFIDTGVLLLCTKYLHLGRFLSKLLANVSTTISNYSLNNKLVFKQAEQ